MKIIGKLLRSVLLSTSAFGIANAATVTGGAPIWHYTTLTSTGSYTPVTGQVLVSGVAQGGCGGGGQTSVSTAGGGGGGSGSYIVNYPVFTIPGNAITATFGSTCSVGAAGSNGGAGYNITLTGTSNTLIGAPVLYGGAGGVAGAAAAGGTGGASGNARLISAALGAGGGATAGGSGQGNTVVAYWSPISGSGSGGGGGASTAGNGGASGPWFGQTFAQGGGTDGGGGGGVNIFGNGGMGGALSSVGLAPTIGNGGGGGGGGANAAGGLPGPGFVTFAELY